MTFEATITGYLKYRTEEALDAARDSLRAGRWLNADDQWQVERVALTSELGPEPTIDAQRRLLVIPPGVYRDLARVTTDLFAGAVDAKIVISSTDLCFDGWIERPLATAASMSPGDPGVVSDIACTALEAYAQSRGLGNLRPSENGHSAWQNSVIRTFHSEYDPDVELRLSSAQ